MYREMLRVQFKWQRLELSVFCVIAFTVPVLVIRGLYNAFAGSPIQSVLQASSAAGVLVAALAGIIGAVIASRPWVLDNAVNQVLSLSLPLEWSQFVRLRFLAGATLLGVPTLALWLGGVFAALALPIPETLHAYPFAFALRFGGAALVFYAMAFLIQYTAGRRAALVVAILLIAWAVFEALGYLFAQRSLTAVVWDVLITWPGPFEVVTARWMLIDV